MEIEALDGQVAKWIAEALRVPVEECDAAYIWDLSSYGAQAPVELTKVDLAAALGRLRAMSTIDEVTLSGPRSYEVLVRDESSFPRIRMLLREDPIRITDRDNALTYSVTGPTDDYLLFLLCKASALASPRALLGPMLMSRSISRGESNEITSVFQVLRQVFSRFISLRLESDRNRTPPEFERFASALLFQLSYNLDAALVPQRHLAELLRTGRLARLRRGSIAEFEPPKRHYVTDLVYHYQLGVATDNPFLAYLSFYHVAEHFFEDVFNEDLVERIRDKLTQPDFSYKRKKDIGLLIRDISRSLQIRNERITFSEQEALRLTIERFVSLPDLITKLDNYDQTLVPYYSATQLGFANAEEVDLRGKDGAAVKKRLAARIYKTRNALVHSKESERARYLPFRDDRILLKDVPMLRFIAEQIILATSAIVTER